MRSNYINFIIIIFVIVLSASGQDSDQIEGSAAPPDWLKSINPADYMLLANDLATPFRMDGDISAQAEAADVSLASESASSTQEVFSFSAREKIASNQNGCPTTSIDVLVEVFESPEIAASARHIGGGAKKGENEKQWWDLSAFTDIRLNNGAGEANAQFANVEWMVFENNEGKWKSGEALQELQIRYKNIVARFSPTMYTGASTTGFGDYARGDTCGLTDRLARLWLDKVSQIKPAEQPDLQITPDGIILAYQADNNFLPLEGPSDKQQMAVKVHNVGEKAAKNVHLQLFVLLSGEGEYQEIGDPVLIGEIGPGEERVGTAVWDLKGENIKDASLRAQAFVPDEKDGNPEDNSAEVKVSIYYAKNAKRSYNPSADGYSFKNFNLTEIETEELVESMLTTIISNLKPENMNEISRAMQIRKDLSAGISAVTGISGGLSGQKALLEHITFAPTYILVDKYMNKMIAAGSGGHCYGMSATSAVYFQDPARKPIDKPVSKMTQKEASSNINAYVRNWFLPFYAALQTDAWTRRLDQGVPATEKALKNSLENERKPLIIEFYGTKDGRSAGHAVLGYKLIEVEGMDPVIYVYDPNFPPLENLAPHPISQIVLLLNENNWANPNYMGYEWASPDKISAAGPSLEIDPEDANVFAPGLKKSIAELAGVLNSLKKALVVLRCPADALFTDSQGRKTGIEDGQIVNEIPGAEVLALGEVEVYQLPLDASYQIAISGKGPGELDLDIIAPVNESGLDLISFQKIATSRGLLLTGELQTGAVISTLKSGSKEIPSALEGSIDAGSAETSRPSEDEKEGQAAPENESADSLESAKKSINEPEQGSNQTQQPLPPVSSSIPASISIFSAEKIDEQKGGKSSPDGTAISYLQRIGNEERYVVAGLKGRINGSFYQSARDFVFSPNGKHYAYKALAGEKWIAVVDGIEGQKYDEVYKIIFSQDGGRYAYMAAKNGQTIVVVDGNEEGPYDSTTGDPIISSAGQHVLYTIIRDGRNHVVVDGIVQEQIGYDPAVSPDGDHWAYSRSASYAGDPCYIVLDGAVKDLGNDNRVAQMVFSPDGRRFAYDLVPGGGAYGNHIVSVDGVQGKEYPFPGVGRIVFSPDGSRTAHWAKVQGEGFVMVQDGVESRVYDEIGDPAFSPDGAHLAYIAKDKDGKFAALDGEEGKRYVDLWGLTFDASGRLAYIARDSRDGKDVRLAVVDGKEDRPYLYDWYGQGIRSGPVFSPDGRHVVYIANDGGRAEYVAIDETRHLNPWTFLGGLSWGEGSPIVFDSADELHYLAENDTGTYLITVQIPDVLASPEGCSWAGIWDTNIGLLDLQEKEGIVEGVYTVDWGALRGKAEGNQLTGKWFDAPTRSEPGDSGAFEFTLSEDCQNFSGNWRYGTSEGWSGEWRGKRAN